MSLALPLWLVALVAGSLGAATTGSLVRNHYRAEIADMRTAQAQDEAAAEAFAREWLSDAHARGDALSANLAATESALHRKSLEVSHALRRLTVGRPCLDGAAVGVLNATYAATPAAVPEAPGAPAATGGAVATDTDVGEWINLAWHRFETCRARLDKLIDYELGAQQ